MMCVGFRKYLIVWGMIWVSLMVFLGVVLSVCCGIFRRVKIWWWMVFLVKM